MKIIFHTLLLQFIFSFYALGSTVTVGSKAFTEGFILSELVAQSLEGSGASVVRRFGMGGTGILFEALSNKKIDLYVEYTGTISEAILKNPELKSHVEIQSGIAKDNLIISQSLGFNNTYAIAVSQELAKEFGLTKISDLKNISHAVKAGFSHEFVNRADGLKALSKKYQIKFSNARSLEHSLAYEAISSRETNLLDVYSTDAKIEKLKLVVLTDDLNFFPKYEAVLFARKDFVEAYPALWQELTKWEGQINESQMIRLNAAVDVEKKSYAAAVSEFLGKSGASMGQDSVASRIWRRTKEHLSLVGVALLFSIGIGIPLGILAVSNPILGQVVLLVSGLFQTIPSLALLCFLIPFFGVGETPALVALCLYGLLPIILNTFVGLKSIEARHLEMSKALGLTRLQSLKLIEFPIASRTVLVGIKTSAVIAIGTATLAALIGAGGYGVPIVTGLATNDMNTILIGALPAALLAVFVHIIFEVLERATVSEGLR